MSWEPKQSSSQVSNRWRPPSPTPSAPALPTPTLKRESWRPTSSWAPVNRPERQAPPDSGPAGSSQPSIPRAPFQDSPALERVSPPPKWARERPYDDDGGYDSRYGSKRDRKAGRSSAGAGAGGERSWEAWNNKVGAATAKRQEEDRRAGPSRRDDYTSLDRKREMEDQATGRSWSAWKSKIGVDDRDRRPSDASSRARERERDEGWRPRRRNDDEQGWRPGAGGDSDRRGGEEGRTWAAYNDKQDARQRGDERKDTVGNAQATRRRADDNRASPRSRSPLSPRKRSPSPARRRLDTAPGRGGFRRESPDYGTSRPRVSPSPPSRRSARDRGSPDYALGADGRLRDRDRDGAELRTRSPLSPPNRRRSPSPSRPETRPLLRDVSPSTSSTSSSQDFSDDDRPPLRAAAWRRDRDRSPRGLDAPEDRYKRQRRQSPDYTPLRRPSPGPVPISAKAPLPPQDALFNNGRGGPPYTRNDDPSRFSAVEGRQRPWERSRGEYSGDHDFDQRNAARARDEDSRVSGRASPDYGAGGATRNAGGPDPVVGVHTRPYSGANQPDPPPTVTMDMGHPAAQRVRPFMPPTGPHADRWPNETQARDGVPTAHPVLQQPTNQSVPSINGSKSPVKIDFGASPSKSNVPLAARPAGLRQFFDTGSPGLAESSNDSPKATTPPNVPASTRESEADMDVDTPSSDRPLHRPEVYLDQIAESEKQYSQHLDTIAPYIRSAFKEWLEQDQTQSLPAFLIHYFGRQPDQRELHQIEQLISLRRQTSKEQADLRDLHALASRNLTGDGRKVENAGAKQASHQALSKDHRSNGHGGPSSDPRQVTPNTSLNASTDSGDAPGRRAQADEAYERLACVGEGTYGKVYKARRADDGVFVALKRIRMEVEKDGFPVTAMREIKLLQSLKHENVIRLHEMMVSKGSVYMVFDYMEHDLTGLLSHPTITFSPANLKSLNHQMLSGLGYLHRVGILHRDMKGSNILLNAQGDLKLADFGLARLYNRKRRADYTNRVITLWYRSPELLLGETAYGPEVDMWSAGCIMLEMFCTKPILQGNDEIHQLEVIHSLMGTPREDDWPEVRNLPWYELIKPKVEIRSKFRDAFAKRLSPAALELAEGLLAMNPAKRLSAKKALETAYFVSEEPSMEKPTHLAGVGEHHEMSAKQERHRRKAEGR